MRAYDINRVSIEERDLPLDAQVDKLKMEAVPFFRSGLLLDFPVRRSHGATLSIRLDDGAPMPSGAIVRIAGRDEEFPVGLGGEAYLTGLEGRGKARAASSTLSSRARPIPCRAWARSSVTELRDETNRRTARPARRDG
jgi:outer membrane usher protein